MLEAVGVEVTAEMRRDLLAREPINRSERGALQGSYDAALAAEVAEADAELCARFGYASPVG